MYTDPRLGKKKRLEEKRNLRERTRLLSKINPLLAGFGILWILSAIAGVIITILLILILLLGVGHLAGWM